MQESKKSVLQEIYPPIGISVFNNSFFSVIYDSMYFTVRALEPVMGGTGLQKYYFPLRFVLQSLYTQPLLRKPNMFSTLRAYIRVVRESLCAVLGTLLTTLGRRIFLLKITTRVIN